MARSLRTAIAAVAIIIAGSFVSRLEPELLAQVKSPMPTSR